MRYLTTTALLLTLAVSGAAYAQDDAGKGGHPGFHKMQQHREEVLSQLPPEKAKLFKDTMKQSREKNEATHEQIKKLRKEKDALLTAEKFDKDAYLAKNVEMDKLYDQMRANKDNAFVSVAAQFSPAERKILAKMHERPMGGGMMPPPADGKEPADKPASK